MRCTFCSETNYWQRFRSRDPSRVVAEIQEQVERWGVRQYLFGDSLLNGEAGWLEAFAEQCIAERLEVRFLFAYLRPAGLPRSTLEAMAAAGFRLVSFGLETASQRLLDALKKGTRVEEAERIVLDCLELGISVNLSILCGLPGETAEDVLASVRFVERLREQVLQRSGPAGEQGLTVHAGSVLRVEPNSRMYRQPERFGIELHEVPPEFPPGLEHLAPSMGPLMRRWSCSVPVEEAHLRARFLLQALNCPPRTVFLEEPLADWIEEDTVVVPVKEARILTDEAGRSFLATANQVLAEVNPLAGESWRRIVRGESFGQIRRALEEANGQGGLDAQLREVFVQLLTHRYVVMDDFAVVETEVKE